MPIYIPVYQRRIDPQTGEPVYDQDGQQIMDQVDTIVVPDPPIIEITEESQALIDAQNAELLTQQKQALEKSSENP